MNPAVALVEAYLQVNGYFTVVEYPVIGQDERGGYTELTDLDVLAFRFPGAGRLVPASRGRRGDGNDWVLLPPDPRLGAPSDTPDMLIAEVKEGKASFNRGLRRRAVLRTALVRFGCCQDGESTDLVDEILRRGRARTRAGHDVRLLAFGSVVDTIHEAPYAAISLAHVVAFLGTWLRSRWDVLRSAQFTHPVLGLLMAIEKARRGDPNASESARQEPSEPTE